MGKGEIMVIDCHAHHVVAPYNTKYLEWLKETGDKKFGPFFLWSNPAFEDSQIRYQKMSENGISCSLNTYSANITQIIDVIGKNDRLDAVRNLNDRMISLCKESGGRWMTTALVDLRLGKEALKEILRCAEFVKGYSVLTSYQMDGRLCFLDDERFEPFWVEAEASGKPVFIHFSNLYKINDPNAPLPGYMNDTLLYAGMGQLMEDAMCVARLVLSGVFDRHPRLKIVIGQLGGMYPFMLERMEMLYTMYERGASHAGLCVTDLTDPEHFLRNMKNYTENIYVDTHSMSVQSVECAMKVLGQDKVLFGSDYPITPDSWGMKHAKKELEKLPQDLYEKVMWKNAQKLLDL